MCVCAVLVIVPVLAGLAGCKAGPARERAAKAEQRARDLAEASDKISEKIEAVQSGELAPERLAESVVPLLPEEYRETFAEAVSNTTDVVTTVLEVNRAIAQSSRAAADEFKRLVEELKDAKDDDDATFAVMLSVVSWLTGSGVLSAVLVPILNRRKERAVTQARSDGAQAVTKSIAVARDLDPNLNAAFAKLNPSAKLAAHQKLDDAGVASVIESTKLGPSTGAA